MATSQELGWIIRSMPWSSILASWGGLGAQRLHRREKQVGWEPLSEKAGSHCTLKGRRSSSELSHPFIATTIAHHQKSESISRGKRWNITRYTSQYILTGKRSKWGWLRMKDRQQKGSQHVLLWQTIINELCKVISSPLPLYLWLDVFSGCIKILPKTIAVYKCEKKKKKISDRCLIIVLRSCI